MVREILALFREPMLPSTSSSFLSSSEFSPAALLFPLSMSCSCRFPSVIFLLSSLSWPCRDLFVFSADA